MSLLITLKMFLSLVFFDETTPLLLLLSPEVVVQTCSVKKMFLETSQNSQENTCARASFLIKLQASGLQIC